jgi:hypothetical protein
LKTVVAFEAMPSTEEKEAIRQKFLSSEISAYEFAKEAEEYLNKQKEPAHD